MFGIFIFRLIWNWSYNISQPRIAAQATVITKRTHFSTNHSSDNFHSSHTTYYITFEFTTGDRKEFPVKENDYGLLREDDSGVLTFQGNKFVGFQRNIS
jgi:hypothetical protein